MATTYATKADVETRLGRPLTPQEANPVAALLADASALLRARVPDLDARLAAGALDAELVKAVTCNMVLRVLRNADGYRSESIGEYSYTRDERAAAGYLYVAADELLALGVDAEAPSRAAFTIRPYSLVAWPISAPDPWPQERS